MVELNHFAIAAALGTTLGPRIPAHHGQLGSSELAATVSGLLQQRAVRIEELKPRKDLIKRSERSVARAYMAVRQNFSADRVLVDPELDCAFIKACRDFGLENSVFHLNLALIGLRKQNKLKAKSKRSSVPEQWRYAVASEIAARMMFYQYGASVDTTLAHPTLVREFDGLASAITPGFSPFEYRWAALNMRKKGSNVRLKSKELYKLDWSRHIPFDAWQRVPADEGVYTLFEEQTCLYVAGTENIHDSIEGQQRIVGVLESELWRPKPERLSWQYVQMPGSNSDHRFGIVRSLVGRWEPVFNIPRGREKSAA
jgi:hypothetical protein